MWHSFSPHWLALFKERRDAFTEIRRFPGMRIGFDRLR